MARTRNTRKEADERELTGSWAALHDFNTRKAQALAVIFHTADLESDLVPALANVGVYDAEVKPGEGGVPQVTVHKPDIEALIHTNPDDLKPERLEAKGAEALAEAQEAFYQEVRRMNRHHDLTTEQALAILREMGFGDSLPQTRTTVTYAVQGRKGDMQVTFKGDITQGEAERLLNERYSNELAKEAQEIFASAGDGELEIPDRYRTLVEYVSVDTNPTWAPHSQFHAGS